MRWPASALEYRIVTDRVLVASRPDRRALRRFRYSLEWMQTAAILLLVLYLGTLVLV
jgi:hypothetical protein